MKTKTGFIVKVRLESSTIFNHFTSQELHLITKCCDDSFNNKVEVKKTTYTTIDEFITQRF